MFKKTITYTNFNDVKVTEDFYFNLTDAELTKLQLKLSNGGADLDKYEAAVNAAKGDNEAVLASLGKNYEDIYNIFETIVKAAYGVRTPDGLYFDKSELASSRFLTSEAYSVLLTEILSDQNKASEFIIGVTPSSKREAMLKYIKSEKPAISAE